MASPSSSHLPDQSCSASEFIQQIQLRPPEDQILRSVSRDSAHDNQEILPNGELVECIVDASERASSSHDQDSENVAVEQRETTARSHHMAPCAPHRRRSSGRSSSLSTVTVHSLSGSASNESIPRFGKALHINTKVGCDPHVSGTNAVDLCSPSPCASVQESDQFGGATLRERNSAMLFSELMADVYFLVGSHPTELRIPAHSYVLSIGSSVFHAMFYGGFLKNEEITVPDVEPNAFKILLRYLYTDDVDLDTDTVLAVLYAAKKYIVPHLTRACISFLESSLTAKNVCLLLCQSRLFEEYDLMKMCWELFDAQAEIAMQSDGFLDIDFQTLETILKRDTLNARETVVFEATIKWAETECNRRGLEVSSANKRAVLGTVFNLIRIPTMDVKEFANGPARTDLLTDQEKTGIFLYFMALDKPQLPFVSNRRRGLEMQSCQRFQSCAYRSNQWRYRGRCDSIQFCTDRRIFVTGFGLYGSSSGRCEYRVQIELKRNESVLTSLNTRFHTDGSSAVFPIYFDQPIQIEADIFYTASAVLDGPELSYFGQEGLPELQVGDANFQFQCSSESTNGTGVQGGQIPEILFYV